MFAEYRSFILMQSDSSSLFWKCPLKFPFLRLTIKIAYFPPKSPSPTSPSKPPLPSLPELFLSTHEEKLFTIYFSEILSKHESTGKTSFKKLMCVTTADIQTEDRLFLESSSF